MTSIIEEEFWYPGGPVALREYSENGHYHREYGPALEEFHPNGIIAQECYYTNGRLDRAIGPAVLFYNENGELENFQFWRQGKRWYPSGHERMLMTWHPEETRANIGDRKRSVPTTLQA